MTQTLLVSAATEELLNFRDEISTAHWRLIGRKRDGEGDAAQTETERMWSKPAAAIRKL